MYTPHHKATGARHSADNRGASFKTSAQPFDVELARKLLRAAIERGYICQLSASELLPLRSQEDITKSLNDLVERKLLRPCKGEEHRRERFRIYEPNN